MKLRPLSIEFAADCAKRLGLGSSWTDSELKSAFRARSFKTHPDHSGNAHDFQAVKDAYDYLSRWGSQVQTPATPVSVDIETKDPKKNYVPCSKCNGTGRQSTLWNDGIVYDCGYCHGTGEVELFNPVMPKMKMGNRKQMRREKAKKGNSSGRFVDKQYV